MENMDWLILACKFPITKPAKKTKKPKARPKAKAKNQKPFFHNSQEQKPMTVYAPHNYCFNILPFRALPTKIWAILAFMNGITLTEQKDYIKNFVKNPYMNKTDRELYDKSFNQFWTDSNSGESIETVLLSYIRKIRTLRARFRRFLHIWRTSRLRPINTEDIVTMEPPKDPVYIVDWATKSKSAFESSTLMRDITLRLLHHDGFFECPQEPRNPYTNSPLTQAQMISVWIQLARSKATASSVFTGLRQVRWILYKFMSEYSLQLQLHAFRTTMRNPAHMDYRDRLGDFINFCYDQEDVEFPKYVFADALLKIPNHRLLKQWSNLCIRYYEATYIHSKSPHKVITIQEDVLDKSVFLMHRYKELTRSL